MTSIADLTAELADHPDADRFVTKLAEAPEPAPGMGPCLLWTRATTGGYGAFSVAGRRITARVWLYTQRHGPVPEGLKLASTCPSHACVIHVAPKTQRETLLAGKGFAAQQAARVWCQGAYGPHDLSDPANVYEAPSRPGERICKPCANETSKEWHRADRANRRRQRTALLGRPAPAPEQLTRA